MCSCTERKPMFIVPMIHNNMRFNAKILRCASRLVQIGVQALNHAAAFLVRRPQCDPSIAEARGTPQRWLGFAAKPDGNRALHRQRIDAGLVDSVPLPLERHHRLRPQRPQDRDLLIHTCTAGAKLRIQALIFHLIPADPNTEPQPPATYDLDLGRLLRDQRSLALREDKDTRRKCKGLCEASYVAEEHKWLMELILAGIADPAGAILRARTENVIVGEDVVVTQPLDGLSKVPQCHRIAAYFCLRKYYSEFHRLFAPFVLLEDALDNACFQIDAQEVRALDDLGLAYQVPHEKNS
jgi:hypothetical protein